MSFELTILGANSALPSDSRFPSSQVLNINDRLYLIDCGEGAQMRMHQLRIRRSRIDHIFISHMHGDHVFGLPGLLTSFHLLGREEGLTIWGPENLESYVCQILGHTSGPSPFPLHFEVVKADTHQCILSNDDVDVYSIPLSHRLPTNGYLFREKQRPRNMRAAMIERYDIPYDAIRQIKAGADWTTPSGLVIPNADLTLAAKPSRSYAYCSDTVYMPQLVDHIDGVDVLYHEATYLEDMREQAEARMHSTAKQAAMIARDANVEQLIIGHYSSRYRDLEPLLMEARSVFPHTELAVDGARFTI